MTLALHNIALEEKIGTNIFNENHLNPRNIVTPPENPSSPVVEQSPMTTTIQTPNLQQTSQPLPTSESNLQSLKFPRKDSEISVMSTEEQWTNVKVLGRAGKANGSKKLGSI